MEVLDHPTDEDRVAFRQSLRGFLARQWPVASAVAMGTQPDALRKTVGALSQQGITALGADPTLGGLCEIGIAMQELGCAHCRAPVLAPMLLNLLGCQHSELQKQLQPLLNGWHMGEQVLCLALGSEDPEASAGTLNLTKGALSGTLRYVDGARSSDKMLVALSATHLAIVDLSHSTVGIEETPLMDMPGLCAVTLQKTPAQVFSVRSTDVECLVALAGFAVASRAYGAARRAFDLVVNYAKERIQFGQAIGSFQAIAHKLANCHIALQSVGLTLENTARQYDAKSGDWSWYAAAATSLAKTSLRQVTLEIHHAFGAIGYSEEHEAPRHFRAVHSDCLLFGAARHGHELVAAHFLDGNNGFPEYDLGAAGNAFRLEVRQWLQSHWSGVRKAEFDAQPFEQREYDPGFARKLGETGWIGLSWPTEFGGQNRSTMEQLAFIEEMERADAPRTGAPVQAVMLQVYGTQQQQEMYLPEILRGEAMFGMGYSEPQAGSDLASLSTKAVRDGDDYVINGQKIWTTTYWGKYMLLATRTQADAKPRHAGLSMFIVPMSAPGITVRASKTMYGGTFANVFYDNVRVPANHMVGGEGEGWKVLTGALATERGLVGGGIALKVVRLFEQLCGHIRQTPHLRTDTLVRQRIGEIASQIEAARQMMVLCARALDKGNMDLADAAVSKVYSGELLERFGECALDMLGLEGALSQHSQGSILNGRVEQALRHSLMWVISIGTNEIQRNLIAQRALGLPR